MGQTISRTSRPRRVARLSMVAVTVAGALLLASGCQGKTTGAGGVGDGATSSPSASSSASSSPSSSPSGPVSLKVTPANLAQVSPNTTVRVVASGGTIGSVAVSDAGHHKVGGTLSTDGLTWTATHYLRPSARYTVQAKAATGTTTSSTFSTSGAKVSATYHLLPSSNATVGVAMPLIVQFDSPVSTKGQAEVERHLAVTTTPHVDGAWGWVDSRQVMFRPAHYWKSGTKVALKANLTGVKTGPGKFVTADASTAYTIGRRQVSVVNTATHHMKVYRNGKVLRVLPVSTGRPGPTTETRNGIKVIVSKEATHIMDSTTIGIPKGSPGYYRLTTQWAMRLTWSGEFLHSAPWSVGSQGSANVSHGCTNLSPSNALWLYNASLIGDPVRYTNSGRKMEPGNGYTLWNYTYAQWQKRSALV